MTHAEYINPDLARRHCTPDELEIRPSLNTRIAQQVCSPLEVQLVLARNLSPPVPWNKIAESMGKSKGSLRRTFARALQKIAKREAEHARMEATRARRKAARERARIAEAAEPKVRALRRQKVAPSLRYAILKRDGFTCQVCRASAAKDHIELHVDHQQPVAKGGTNDEANLWTLCARCNLTKSDRL